MSDAKRSQRLVLRCTSRGRHELGRSPIGRKNIAAPGSGSSDIIDPHGIRNPSQPRAMKGHDMIASTMHGALGFWLCQLAFKNDNV